MRAVPHEQHACAGLWLWRHAEMSATMMSSSGLSRGRTSSSAWPSTAPSQASLNTAHHTDKDVSKHLQAFPINACSTLVSLEP